MNLGKADTRFVLIRKYVFSVISSRDLLILSAQQILLTSLSYLSFHSCFVSKHHEGHGGVQAEHGVWRCRDQG